MRVIYKYPIQDVREIRDGVFCCAVPLYAGAIIRHVAFQDRQLRVWAEVETMNDHAERVLYLYSTGRAIEQHEKLRYLCTVVQDQYVWHVFEEVPK